MRPNYPCEPPPLARNIFEKLPATSARILFDPSYHDFSHGTIPSRSPWIVLSFLPISNLLSFLTSVLFPNSNIELRSPCPKTKPVLSPTRPEKPPVRRTPGRPLSIGPSFAPPTFLFPGEDESSRTRRQKDRKQAKPTATPPSHRYRAVTSRFKVDSG